MVFNIELKFYKNEGWTFDMVKDILNKKHIYNYDYTELKKFYYVEAHENI